MHTPMKLSSLNRWHSSDVDHWQGVAGNEPKTNHLNYQETESPGNLWQNKTYITQPANEKPLLPGHGWSREPVRLRLTTDPLMIISKWVRPKLSCCSPCHSPIPRTAYDIRVRVLGGGITGQAGAIRHGITKALIQVEPDLRQVLEKGRVYHT